MASDNASVSKAVEIVNQRGLHARASARLAKEAGYFQSVITVCKHDSCVTATSIMGLMMLGAAKGDTIKVSVKGPDHQKALNQIVALVENRFGESE